MICKSSPTGEPIILSVPSCLIDRFCELPRTSLTLSLPLNLVLAQIELKLVEPSPIFVALLLPGIILPSDLMRR